MSPCFSVLCCSFECNTAVVMCHITQHLNSPPTRWFSAHSQNVTNPSVFLFPNRIQYLPNTIYSSQNFLITGRMLRSSNLLVLNLLTGQKSAFSPRRGDSFHRFTWNLAQLRDTWVRLAVQNFTPIGARGGNAAHKMAKNPLLGNKSPRRGEPYIDRFLQ